jgi:hypothetical protein
MQKFRFFERLRRAILPLWSIARELRRLNDNLERAMAHFGVDPVPDAHKITLFKEKDRTDRPGVLYVDEERELENEIRESWGLPRRSETD